MSKIPRYLITSGDERTWKFDRPVLFLGEWCLLYDRRHIWQGMDSIVAKPYGLGREQKDMDHVQARDAEKKLFPVLCDLLNEYHGNQHGERFWRIVLGHWFRRYIEVILNRLKTLEQCLETYQLTGTAAFINESYSLATCDSYSAIWAFSDDRWNNELYIRILDLLGEKRCSVEKIVKDSSEGYSFPEPLTEVTLAKKNLNRIFQKISKVSELMVREEDAFIVNSYLPKKEELKLQLRLLQFPQLWRSPKLKLTDKPDQKLRKRLSLKIQQQASERFYQVTSNLLFELLPVCYLEGFVDLNEKVKQLPWPKKPKLIYTANNFDTDEQFKLWTAIKVESGCKYLTGQHGNNYGTSRYMYPSIEEVTSEKFITWGWTDGLLQHTPAFIFKIKPSKDKAYDAHGGLLLIELYKPHHISTWDGIFEFGNYFADQQKFVEKICVAPKNQIFLRMHGVYRYMRWSEEARWYDFDPNLIIDTGTLPIGDLISKSRLVVHSYDSTGILETLSQNIPTLAFWQNGFDNLRESAKPFYQLLLDAGIVHFGAESAAMKVNEIWDDVDGWWAQKEVQEARTKFCNRYAKVSQNPVFDLIKIFSEN